MVRHVELTLPPRVTSVRPPFRFTPTAMSLQSAPFSLQSPPLSLQSASPSLPLHRTRVKATPADGLSTRAERLTGLGDKVQPGSA